MERVEITYLSIDSLQLMGENPNEQSDAVFNNLVENIQEIGMVEPIMVAPVVDEDGSQVAGQYRIVSGEHRFEACRLLDYKEIPCIVQENFDDDMAKFQLVRMNMLKGKLNPVKFTQLYTEMADKYGDELVKVAMGLVDEDAFNKLFIDVQRELPQELQDKMNEAKEDIKNVDDLSRILNEMFSTYGDTLQNNFMIFQYGGKTHLWVMMDKDLKTKLVDETLGEIKAGGYDIAEYFKRLIIDHGDEVMGQLEPLAVVDESIFDGPDEEEPSLN